MSFVLEYHGCEKKVGEAILAGHDHVARRQNVYDWPGHGAYFWENSGRRALSRAEFFKGHPRDPGKEIQVPFMIGAVIDLGNCLDLTDAGSLKIVRTGCDEFVRTVNQAGAPLPVNKAAHGRDIDHRGGGRSSEHLLLVKRKLACAVLNFVHALRDRKGKSRSIRFAGFSLKAPSWTRVAGLWR